MTTQSPPEITPQVVHLVDLLKRAREGRLRIPLFQREFVWRRQDIVDLFDSIAGQYPIGTLFLWGGDRSPKTRPRIGPLVLPNYAGEKFLVLDGQQRLTTLVGVLLSGDQGWSSEGQDDPEQWRVFYDAETSNFLHAGRDPIPVSYIPVSTLLDTVRLFAQVEKMIETEGVNRRDVFKWINRAQEVARALQSYRIPIVEIKTDSLSIAVESFSRLNKKGRTIGQDEMFSALTYEDGSFHLAAEIDALQSESIQCGFGEVDRATLLRSVLTAAGLDIYRTDWALLAEQSKENVREKLPAAVAEARQGLELARKFLTGLGVINARMLPYSMQLVALSAFFGRCPIPTDSQKQLLRRWFWSSAFAGWFGFGNSAKMKRLVDEFRDKVAINPVPVHLENMDLDQPALPTPARFDLRSARVRAMVCVLLNRLPMRPDGSAIALADTAALLAARGPESMTNLCASVGNDDLRRSPANRILDVGIRRGQAKTWLLDLPDSVRDVVLRSHAIAPETFTLLTHDLNDDFLNARLHEIARIEREFMASVGVTEPEKTGTQAAPLDVENEWNFT